MGAPLASYPVVSEGVPLLSQWPDSPVLMFEREREKRRHSESQKDFSDALSSYLGGGGEFQTS